MTQHIRYMLRILLLSTLVGTLDAVAAGPWHAAEPNTSGWYYMTPNERVEHQRRMRSFETYEECKAYQAEHHVKMAERTRQKGIELQPRVESGCDQLRRRGKFQ